MPRLLILTQYFPPEMGAPQARLSELGERLLDLGWDVEVLTALPNYPTGRVFAGYDPSKPMRERVGRLEVARVPILTARGGFAARLGSYFSFVAAAVRHGPSLCARPDLLWVESPPLFVGFAAQALSKRWRCRYVFNVSDLWPESAVRMGVIPDGPVARIAERLELAFYRGAAGVTGQSDEIVESVRRRAPGTLAEVISNGVDVQRFGKDRADEGARALLRTEGAGPVFVYAGLLGLAQGLDQILDAAKAMPDDVAARFVLIGDGPVREKLERRIERERIGRVRLLPAQPRDRVPALLAAADAAVITLGMKLPGAVPSKIYEAMASGLPIVLVAEGEAAERVKNAAAGIAVAPNQPAALVDALCALARDEALRQRMGAAGRAAAESLYDRARIAERLDAFLRRSLSSAA